MKTIRTIAFAAASALAFGAGAARADYETHTDLLPHNRCVTSSGDSFADADVDPIHCQKLFWDLPASPDVGTRAAGAKYLADPVPRFPRGLTDRIPPLYGYDGDNDGVADDCPKSGYYAQFPFCGDGHPDGFETPGPNGVYDAATNPTGDRFELCPNVGEVPWWRPIWANADNEEVEGKKGQPLLGYGEGEWAENGSMGQQEGQVYEVSCRRGSRAYFGPWQVGTDPNRFDREARRQRA